MFVSPFAPLSGTSYGYMDTRWNLSESHRGGTLRMLPFRVPITSPIAQSESGPSERTVTFLLAHRVCLDSRMAALHWLLLHPASSPVGAEGASGSPAIRSIRPRGVRNHIVVVALCFRRWIPSKGIPVIIHILSGLSIPFHQPTVSICSLVLAIRSIGVLRLL